MAEHPNLERMRGGYQAFQSGDLEGLTDFLAEDVLWHVQGDSVLSGDYKGHQEVLGLFGRLAQESEGTFKIDVHDLLANDEHGVALVQMQAEREGKTLDQRIVHVFHLEDGKVTEFWGFPEDSEEVTNFYGRA